MKRIFTIAGNAAAVLGVLICLVTGVFRLAGNYYVFGFEAQTLFIGGIALMVMACLAKLHEASVP